MPSPTMKEKHSFWKRQISSTADTPQNRGRDEGGGQGAVTQIIAQQYPSYNPNNATSPATVITDTQNDQEAQRLNNKNMKAIVTACLVVVSILLVLFILYLFWRTYKRKRREKKRKELIEEANGSEPGRHVIQPPPPVLTVRIESDSSISKATLNSSHGPSMSTLHETSPISKPHSVPFSHLNESSSSSSFRAARNQVQSRPSGLSLNTTASMLTGSERHDTCSTPMTSPNYDENAYRLSRALQSSPVVSALLYESFDTQAVRKNGKQKEGERSFDWTQCEFEKEEEAAMWLPELKTEFSQVSYHNRTISEPAQIGIAADRRGDSNDTNSPISPKTTLEQLASSTPTSATSTHFARSPSLVIVPYSPRSATLSRHATNKASDPSHSRNFVVMSRQRPSSAGVLSTTFETTRPQHLRTVSSVVSDSECSTESLRRAGALAIRNSVSSLKMGDSNSLSSPISTKGRHKDSQYPPSASRSTTTNKRLKKPSSSGSGSGKSDNIELFKMNYGFEAVAT
ncbi:uncharacterized protein FA14DRAFT_189140 [Meira miltonrushii]|uniref:Uncharacterized protein n=1 Tax=Meira miltonrushii TaxID=1280837 RepID=A0A316VBU7_9BASI|nr:uncharacterized protein FA14DRAFT_189140 [Meira miltonrushii]PWN35137.1 hypothetical protein FA14DRAFT_189140 [Meira miltonrushii]